MLEGHDFDTICRNVIDDDTMNSYRNSFFVWLSVLKYFYLNKYIILIKGIKKYIFNVAHHKILWKISF